MLHIKAVPRWRARFVGCLLVGCLVLGCLGACASSVIAPQSSDVSAPVREEPTAVEAHGAQDVRMDESAWWAKDSYVHYGITVTNPNEDVAAQDVRVHVALYDETDALICEADDTIALIGPGQTVGFAGEAGNGWAPTRVEISVDGRPGAWIDGTAWEDPFEVVSYEETNKLYFRYEISGQLRNDTEDYVSAARLSVLMRDEAGQIVAGYIGEAYRIKSGQTKDFLLTVNTAPDHATIEVWAQPIE